MSDMQESADLELAELSSLTRTAVETKALHDGLDLVSVDDWKKSRNQNPVRNA